MRPLVFALCLWTPAVASADARKDIVDLRHGRYDSYEDFQGWAADGRAVARVWVCSEGGELTCRADIVEHAPGVPATRTSLFHRDDLYDVATPANPKGSVSTAEATAFIRAESKALAAVGTLDAGRSLADPTEAFGPIGGENTEVYLRTSKHPLFEEALQLHIAVRGARGASVDLLSLDNEPWRVSGVDVIDANVSPDGASVFVAMHYEDGAMCWDGEDIATTVADRFEVRAKLANAIGLRADRAGETDEAYDRFVDATGLDPAYAWGWFNRAALESRRGDTSAAATSLRHAVDLDPTKAARACGDADFDALKKTTDGAALMGC